MRAVQCVCVCVYVVMMMYFRGGPSLRIIAMSQMESMNIGNPHVECEMGVIVCVVPRD